MHPKNEFKTMSFVFACIGMATVQTHFRPNVPIRNFLLSVPTGIQLIIVVYVVLLYLKRFSYSATLLGAYIDMIQVFGLLVVGIIQIVENISKSQIDQRIKESIESVDREIFLNHHCPEWNRTECDFCQKLSLKRFLISRTACLLLLSLAIDSIILLTLPDDQTIWRHSIYLREFTANMIRIGLLYVACHFYWVNTWHDHDQKDENKCEIIEKSMEILFSFNLLLLKIRSRLQFVQMNINRTIQIALKHPYSRNANCTALKVIEMKSLYGRLWKINSQINERFNWTVCAVMNVYFCTMFVSFYWVFMRFILNEFDTISHEILVLLPLLIPIIVLISEVENWKLITKQIKKSIFTHKKFNDELTRKVRRFTYMIQLCPFQFSVMGLFELNKRIYVSIIGIMTSFLCLLYSLEKPR